MLLESDVMIVFKKLRCKRSNGFEVLDDDDEPEPLVQHREEKTLRSDLKRKTEPGEITAPIEQHESDHTICGSGIHKTLIIDDCIMIPKKKQKTDVPRDVKLDVSHKISNLDVKKVDAENDHIISSILPTGKKKYPQRRCVYCRDYSVPRDTRYYCKVCVNTPALCKTPCFAKYHGTIDAQDTESNL